MIHVKLMLYTAGVSSCKSTSGTYSSIQKVTIHPIALCLHSDLPGFVHSLLCMLVSFLELHVVYHLKLLFYFHINRYCMPRHSLQSNNYKLQIQLFGWWNNVKILGGLKALWWQFWDKPLEFGVDEWFMRLSKLGIQRRCGGSNPP